MAKLEVNPFKFDSRLMEWNLKHNLVSKTELKGYLDSLPDETENAETLTLDDDDAVADGDFEEPVY